MVHLHSLFCLPPPTTPTLIWHTDDKKHRGVLSRFLSFFWGSPPFSSPALGPIITDRLSVVLIPDYLLPTTSGSWHRAPCHFLSLLCLCLANRYTSMGFGALLTPNERWISNLSFGSFRFTAQPVISENKISSVCFKGHIHHRLQNVRGFANGPPLQGTFSHSLTSHRLQWSFYPWGNLMSSLKIPTLSTNAQFVNLY